MDKIQKKQVTMRSRTLFLAQSLGIKSVLVLLFLAALLFGNLMLYSLQASGALSMLGVGDSGVWAFLELFPYGWVVLAVIFFVLLSFLWKRFDIAYKQPFQRVLLALLLLVISGSILFAISGANERITEAVEEHEVTVLKPFFGRRPLSQGGRFHAQGSVLAIQEQHYLIAVGKRNVQVLFNERTVFPDGHAFEKGETLFAVGKWQSPEKTVFLAKGISKRPAPPPPQHQRKKMMKKLLLPPSP